VLSRSPARRATRSTALSFAAALAAVLACAVASPAQAVPVPTAAGGSSTVTTTSGLTVTATPVRRLDPAGAVVRVSGKGFDRTVGIYVALCVTPRKGRQPSPCGGGVNTGGTSPASAWISSNPPPYGSNLAVPFGRGGSFVARLQVSSMIGTIDCRTVSCSIVTRADHTHPGERGSDVAVRVTFAP
jgi:hypothetical protein